MDIQDMRIVARVAAVQNCPAVFHRTRADRPDHLETRIHALEDRTAAGGCFEPHHALDRSTKLRARRSCALERILSRDRMRARASVDDKVTKPKGQATRRRSGLPGAPLQKSPLPFSIFFVFFFFFFFFLFLVMRTFPEIESVDLNDRQGQPARMVNVAISPAGAVVFLLIANRHGTLQARHRLLRPAYVARRKGRPMRPR